MHRFFRFSFLLAIAFIVASSFCSCGDSIPSEYLQPKELEEVLYDYHVALGMLYGDMLNDENRAYNERLYKLAVLKKHNVSEEKFEKSMVYYMRHAEDLQKVYKSLSERVRAEAAQVGASMSAMNAGVVQGDTANVWPLEPGLVLMQRKPNNVMSFVIKADTAYHKGDRFNLGFDTQFLYQEGFKDGIAMLAVQYKNDSVATRTTHFSSNSRYNLEVTDNDNLGVKEIRGFFYLNKEQNAQTTTTLKLLFINRIQLLRMRIHEAKQAVKSTPDSIGRNSAQDDRENKPRHMNRINAAPDGSGAPVEKLER